MEQSIKLMLGNRIVEAEAILEEASLEIGERKIDFEGGEHDLRGGFSFITALFATLNGLASMQNNQLEIASKKFWAADEQLAEDKEWAGQTVLRGLCILVAGVVQVMQGGYAKGVWHILRSWLYLRYLESDGLNFDGHERSCVRSTSLLGLGVFNLIVSMLPPRARSMASYSTGFEGGRETALTQLRQCFDEGGINSPFAGLILVGFAVDVSNFLGEFSSQRDERLREARSILDWSKDHHPDCFFFAAQEANYQAAVRNLDGAIETITSVAESVQDKPAFTMMVHVRTATLQACKFNWAEAAKAYRGAAEVHRSVGRRAFCPALLLNTHLCYMLAGEKEQAAEALDLCLTYKKEKKKWSAVDTAALADAERALAAASDESEVKKDTKGMWRPKMLFFLKITLLYRGANFMSLDDANKFLSMLKEETDLCGDDVEARCLGIALQAESLRQMESWDEALEMVSRGVALEPQMSGASKKEGSLHYLQMVSAYAHYSKGNLTAAQEALRKLDALGTAGLFAKAIDFKATYLKECLGMQFQDAYRECAVGARSRSRLLVDIDKDVETVSCDWVLKDKTISFRAVFQPSDESDSIVVESAEQYEANSGPFEFTFDVPAPGRLELVFDNTFSYMTGKSIQIRVQPDSLPVTEENKI